MPYNVSYSTSVGAVASRHETTREALDQAEIYLNQGHRTVTMKDIDTGEVFDTIRIQQALESIARQERNS